MLAPVLTVAPASRPVSVTEAKAHLRVESGDDDALIGSLIMAATQHLDGWSGVLGRALVTQTWRIDLERWWCTIRLPLAPVQEASIAYTDPEGGAQALTGAFTLLADARGPFLERRPEASLPALATAPDAVRVTFVAGYGDAAAVPAPIRHAILMLVAHWYRAREAATVGAVGSVLPFAVDALIGPYRRVGV